MAYRIELIEGPQKGESYPIDPEHGVMIGRSPTNNVFLRDRSVSRAHCQVRIQDGECVIEDLGSTNGTFVNGGRVTEAPLGEGDVAQIGFSKMQILRVDDEDTTATTAFVDEEFGEEQQTDATRFVADEELEDDSPLTLEDG